MKKIYDIMWTLLMLAFAFGCQDLEDTYSEYAGDGMIRYVGKCTDVKVAAGWERLLVSWNNNLDPAIENIRLICKCDSEIVYDTLLDASATSCNLEHLGNNSYGIDVCAVDAAGNASLTETAYGRPITAQHESVMSFTIGVTKHYFVGNNLVMIFDNDSKNIKNIQLKYFDMSGQIQTLDSLQKKFSDKYMLLENVDTSKEIMVNREGYVESCIDDIILQPYQLTQERVFSPAFRSYLLATYGVEDISDEFVESRRSLEVDHDIMSFEDVLYFPNLERLVLGANRYLEQQVLDLGYWDNAYSTVTEFEKSMFLLQVAQKLRNLRIERYNQHYFSDEESAKTELKIVPMGNPVLPQLDYLDTQGWTISCSEPYDSKPLNLLDNNYVSVWKTSAHPSLTTYELVIDMKESKRINGVVIAQPLDLAVLGSMQNRIELQISNDEATWENLTYQQANTIGNSIGEKTLLRLPQSKEAQFIRVVISDMPAEYTSSIALGDIAVF